MNQRPIRVLCVDDNQALAEAMQIKLAVERDLQTVGRLHSADGLLVEVKKTNADVVLLDIEMPGRDTFEVVRELIGECPKVRVIILSAHVRDDYIDTAVGAGVWGYMCKGDRPDDIVHAVRRVSQGEFVLGPEVMEHCKRSGWKPGNAPA